MSKAHPYRPAFAVGDVAFVSGALSIDSAECAVPGRTKALAASMQPLGERLATIGLDLSYVVKATYFVIDVSPRGDERHTTSWSFPPRDRRAASSSWAARATGPPSR